MNISIYFFLVALMLFPSELFSVKYYPRHQQAQSQHNFFKDSHRNTTCFDNRMQRPERKRAAVLKFKM